MLRCAAAFLGFVLTTALVGATDARAYEPTPEQRQAIESVYSLDWSSGKPVTGQAGGGPGRLSGLSVPAKPPSAVNAGVSGGGVKVLNQPAFGNSLYFGQSYASNRGGGLVGCSIELFTDTPRPTRGIRYGETLNCTDPEMSGSAIVHLADIQGGTPRPVQTDQAYFGVDGSSQDRYEYSSYARESDSQLEVVYGYFTITLPGGRWLTQPSGAASSINCSPVGGSTLTCEVISNPFAFIPDTLLAQSCIGVGTGICEQARQGRELANQAVSDAPAVASKALTDAQAAAVAAAGLASCDGNAIVCIQFDKDGNPEYCDRNLVEGYLDCTRIADLRPSTTMAAAIAAGDNSADVEAAICDDPQPAIGAYGCDDYESLDLGADPTDNVTDPSSDLPGYSARAADTTRHDPYEIYEYLDGIPLRFGTAKFGYTHLLIRRTEKYSSRLRSAIVATLSNPTYPPTRLGARSSSYRYILQPPADYYPKACAFVVIVNRAAQRIDGKPKGIITAYPTPSQGGAFDCWAR